MFKNKTAQNLLSHDEFPAMSEKIRLITINPLVPEFSFKF
jgi:hypothetical protein